MERDGVATSKLPVVPGDLDPIRMSTAAFETIAREAPASADGTETGGALFGFDGGALGPPLITHAGTPGPAAVRKGDFFLRDRAHAQDEADAAYAECCARWIGEWHTHPAGLPQPSQRDITSYLAHLSDHELAFETFLSLIVVPEDKDWAHAIVAAWEVGPSAMWLRGIDLTPAAEAAEEALRRASQATESEGT